MQICNKGDADSFLREKYSTGRVRFIKRGFLGGSLYWEFCVNDSMMVKVFRNGKTDVKQTS